MAKSKHSIFTQQSKKQQQEDPTTLEGHTINWEKKNVRV